MTILSTVCTKLLCTNAHLGRLVAAHHLKVYIRGSRNGIAILDSDKTLICLRTALHFIGSLIRKKGRSFFLKTNHFFIYLIMEKMRYSIMQKIGSCINDSQWKIGAFLTNSYANPKKFRSRKKKIHFGLNQQPDCVVIPNPDRKSSVILEANRSQIPIASLADSTITWEFYKRITYPIPANDTIQFIYLFLNSITKTVILERKRITAMRPRHPFSGIRRSFSSSSSHSSFLNRFKSMNMKQVVRFAGILLVWWGSTRYYNLLKVEELLCGVSFDHLAEHFSELLKQLCEVLSAYLACGFQCIFETFARGPSATLEMGPGESTGSSVPSKVEWQKPLLMEAGEGSTREERKRKSPINLIDSPPRHQSLIDFIEVPSSPEEGARPTQLGTTQLPAPSHSAEGSAHARDNREIAQVPPAPAAAPQDIDPGILNAKGKIYLNLTTLYGSMDQRQAIELTDIIYSKKEQILEELRRLDHSPVNSQILWQHSGDTIRNPKSGGEYNPPMLDMILDSLQQYGRGSEYYERLLNGRIAALSNEELMHLRLNDLPMDRLEELNQAKLVRLPGEG